MKNEHLTKKLEILADHMEKLMNTLKSISFLRFKAIEEKQKIWKAFNTIQRKFNQSKRLLEAKNKS
jgi:hypothetical protein